jgi:hypothetical protein
MRDDTPSISKRQSVALWSMVWRFRRQIPRDDLIEYARQRVIPDTTGRFLQ